jgi:hypothetical protein
MPGFLDDIMGGVNAAGAAVADGVKNMGQSVIDAFTGSGGKGKTLSLEKGWKVGRSGNDVWLFNPSGQPVRKLKSDDVKSLLEMTDEQRSQTKIDNKGVIQTRGTPGGAFAPYTPAWPNTGSTATSAGHRESQGSGSGYDAGGGGGGYNAGAGGGGGNGGSSYPFTPPSPIGGTGDQNITGDTPLQIKDPGRMDMGLGSYFQPQGGSLGRMPSMFDNLGPNPTVGDIIGATTRRQEAGLQGRLDLLGGSFNESLGSPESTAQRGLIRNILANPESMDAATLGKIKGRQNAAIGQRAGILARAAGDRAASMGVGRDVGQMAQERIYRQAGQQQTQSETDLDVKATMQNFQDRRGTLAAAGGAIQQDQGARRDIVNEAQRAIGESQVYGDAFLSTALMGRQGQPNIAGGIKWPTPQYSY